MHNLLMLVCALQSLVQRKAALQAVREPEGKTPLHLVAHAGMMAAAEVLIARRADIDIVDNDDRTPLHVAALNGHGDIVELLIQHGASPHFLDKNDQTALHFACIGGYLSVCGTLISAEAFVEVSSLPPHTRPLEEYPNASPSANPNPNP